MLIKFINIITINNGNIYIYRERERINTKYKKKFKKEKIEFIKKIYLMLFMKK